MCKGQNWLNFINRGKFKNKLPYRYIFLMFFLRNPSLSPFLSEIKKNLVQKVNHLLQSIHSPLFVYSLETDIRIVFGEIKFLIDLFSSMKLGWQGPFYLLFELSINQIGRLAFFTMFYFALTVNLKIRQLNI